MSSVNKVILIGHLGGDPTIRHTNDGRAIANFSIATSESWKDKNTGEKREKTEWHRVVIFNEGLAKVAEQYLKKGSRCYVEGQLQTRKWQDQQGQDRYSTEVVLQNFRGQLTLLDGKPQSAAGEYEQERREDARQAKSMKDLADDPYEEKGRQIPGRGDTSIDLTDEIPF